MSVVAEGTDDDTHANASAQIVIDERIAHLQECIRQLKAQRNGLAPISRLPPEILATIFAFISAGRTRNSRLFPCYNFTHVSRSWRSVALDAPNLWQVLPQNTQWATVMLERSKGADLVVGSQLSDPYNTPSRPLKFLTEVLAKHAPRIRELDLCGVGIPTLFENLPQSSLRLHSLKLDCSIRNENRAFPTGVMETSNLRTLTIFGCGGAWCSLSLPALITLKLSNIPNRPPLTKFLEMLRGAPALEVLDMESSLPLRTDHVGLIGPIELPHLSHLCLSSKTDHKEVTNILSVLNVPRTATVKLSIVQRGPMLTNDMKVLDEIKTSLSTFFCRDTNLSYRNLRVYSRDSQHLHLIAWKDDGGASPTPDLDLDLTLHAPLQNVLRPIYRSLPLSNITTLSLDYFESKLLKDAFGQLPRLRNVKVSGDSTAEFIQALTSKPKKHNIKSSAYYSVTFPALQSLWIDNHSFKESGTCTVEDLQDCLMERYERNAELLKLKLTECSELWSEDVESLRDIVNEVEWDELETCDDSDDSEDEDEDDMYSDEYGYSDDYWYS